MGENKIGQKGYITLKQKMWIDEFSKYAHLKDLKSEEEVFKMTVKDASKYLNKLRGQRYH